MFNFNHLSGQYGRVSISANKAASILAVSLKTAKKYASDPIAADPCKMAHLEAVVCRRIIPNSWQVWVDGDSLHTDNGYSINKSEIQAFGWLRQQFNTQNRKAEKLEKRIAELENEVLALKNNQTQKKAEKLPSNVVEFKPR